MDPGKRAIDVGGRCIHRDRRVAAELLLGEVGGTVSINLGPMVGVVRQRITNVAFRWA
jgi:hypothetical protein